MKHSTLHALWVLALVALGAVAAHAGTIKVDTEITGGTVTVDKATAAAGETVTITIAPNDGYALGELKVMDGGSISIPIGGGEINDGWADAPRRAITYSNPVEFTLNDAKTQATFTMTENNVEITATFVAAAKKLAIVYVADHGTIEGPSEAAKGEKVTITITPDAGYELDKVEMIKYIEGGGSIGEGESVAAPRRIGIGFNDGDDDALKVTVEGNTATFTMPEKSVKVTATFKELPKNEVAVADGIANGAIATDLETAAAGETVTITVTPATGYELSTLTVNTTANNPTGAAPRRVSLNGNVAVTEVAAGKTYTFVMPDGDVNVTATFSVVSGIDAARAEAAVTAVRYINVAGHVSDTAFPGLNIVVKTLTDGTVKTTKVVF